ncbi:MAG TPA: hypothetical protein VG738_10345 [Chitinophagaceae bacterium]|nr:hypothetical protein [Chitinophagaceae bacterium]
MKRMAFGTAVIITTFFYSCGNKKNIPDVSGIHVQLDTLRFEKDFFSIDTLHTEQALDMLQQKYPAFLNDFLYNLLALPPNKDSALVKVNQFIHDYKPVYDSVSFKYPSIKPVAEQVMHALQFVKYYFPKYKTPPALITFTGPLEGYSNVLTSSGFAVGLQLYLGKNYPAYNTDYIADVYPQYQSRRFEQPYIAIDCIKNIISDIYPPGNNNQPLIYQMIEAGKRLYVLDAFMPETPDTLKTGYTKEQLDGCIDNEASIWNFFVQQNLLYVKDVSQTRDYMNDGPRTETMGPKSPGFIGQFVGWQIVKKWMAQDSKRTIPVLLQTPPQQIFEEAKYKPR